MKVGRTEKTEFLGEKKCVAGAEMLEILSKEVEVSVARLALKG